MVNARKAEEENANAKAEASLKTVAENAAEKKKGVKIPYNKCEGLGMSKSECWTTHMPDSAYNLAQKQKEAAKKAQAKQEESDDSDSDSDSDSDNEE